MGGKTHGSCKEPDIMDNGNGYKISVNTSIVITKKDKDKPKDGYWGPSSFQIEC